MTFPILEHIIITIEKGNKNEAKERNGESVRGCYEKEQ